MFSIYGSALMVGFKEELFKINATFVKNPNINATYLNTILLKKMI